MSASSPQRMVRRFREWVSREVETADLAEWWVEGWERTICAHVDEMRRATGMIWTNKTKRRLHRLILMRAKRRYWQARRRLAVARSEKETPNAEVSHGDSEKRS